MGIEPRACLLDNEKAALDGRLQCQFLLEQGLQHGAPGDPTNRWPCWSFSTTQMSEVVDSVACAVLDQQEFEPFAQGVSHRQHLPHLQVAERPVLLGLDRRGVPLEQPRVEVTTDGERHLNGLGVHDRQATANAGAQAASRDLRRREAEDDGYTRHDLRALLQIPHLTSRA